jgi:hypothetical protein
MLIRLRVEATQPISGQVESEDDRSSLPFVGWLGLLQALSDLVADVGGQEGGLAHPEPRS